MERFQFDLHRAVSALLHSAVLVSRDAAAFCSTLLCRSLTVVALQPTVKHEHGLVLLCARRMDDASINWVEPTDPPEGAPPPDIPGRQKDRVSSPKWMDLLLDLGPTERELLTPVPQEQRPK